MADMINIGMVVVVPSGNYAHRNKSVATLPASSANADAFEETLPLIVAGAVDINGATADFLKPLLPCGHQEQVLYTRGKVPGSVNARRSKMGHPSQPAW